MEDLEAYWERHNSELMSLPRYSTWAFKQLLDEFDLKNKKCLDVGCGYGLILEYLRGRNAIVEGLELCANVVAKVKDFKVVEGDCRNMPIESNTYDFVTSLGVVEHFPEWKQAIAEHFRVCKPGGFVVISVPYVFSPVYPIMLAYYIPIILRYGIRITAGRPFSKGELVGEVSKYGKVLEIKAFDFCCLLEPLTKEVHTDAASILERYFGGVGLMLYCVVRKEAEKE